MWDVRPDRRTGPIRAEFDRNGLNHIRQNLQLDEEHGIDSKVFHEAESGPDDFIQHYRTMLRRLARL